MDAKQLNLILEEGEGYFVEFKESISKIDREIVAFTNSSGGRIFLGISDSSVVKGFALKNKTKSEILSIAENCDPPIRVTIEKFNIIAIINVPEGNRKPYKCSSGFYLRNGATSQKMNTDDIVAFIQNEGRIKFDELFENKFDFEQDFDLSKYRNYIRKSGISADFDFKDMLQNLGLLAFEDKKVLLNNTGILFFAKNPTKFFVQSLITCVLYKGNEKLNILDRKDFSEDLISNIEDAIIFLKKHLNISYKINKLQREDILEIPETALREAIVNSVVHRDYFEKGANVIIEIYDDRVEISNPGGLPNGMKESEFGTKSVARNPLIASLMLRANYIEKLGTGIKRIQNALKKAGLPEADFELGNFFTIKFARITKEKINEEVFGVNVGVNVGINVGERIGIKGKRLSRILILLNLINKGEFIDFKNVGENVGINDRTIERDISLLKKKGLIEYIGSRRSGKYITTDEFKELLINNKTSDED